METHIGMWTMGSHQKQRCLCIRINIPKCIAFFLRNACHNTDGENQSHFSAGISVWRPWMQACISGLKAFVFSLCLHFHKLVFSIKDICQTWWELQMATTSVLYFFSISELCSLKKLLCISSTKVFCKWKLLVLHFCWAAQTNTLIFTIQLTVLSVFFISSQTGESASGQDQHRHRFLSHNGWLAGECEDVAL